MHNRCRGSIISLTLFLAGCTTAVIPAYLQERNPYTQRFYGGHEKVLMGVKQSLKDLGWVIEKETDPVVYEQPYDKNLEGRQVLLITESRQTPMFLGTRYARMNVYIRSGKDVSDVQVRYMTITSTVLKNFKSYRNDSAVARFLARVEENLKQNQSSP